MVSNRVFWAVVCVTCSAILSAGVVAQGVLGTVRANTFQIVDARGVVRGEMGVARDGTAYMTGVDTQLTQSINDLRLQLNALQQQREAQVSTVGRSGAVTAGQSGPIVANTPPTKEQVYEHIKDLALKELKSPEKAQFAPFAEAEVKEITPGKQWSVRGWVISENSFGAVGRADFIARMRRLFDGRLVLDEFTIK